MGRKKKVVYFQPKRLPVKKAPADPQRQLETMPPVQLVQGINNLLRSLEKKGVKIADYDHKERELYSIQQIGGRYYFLAAEPDPNEPEGRG